jgi:hypothetical protein
MYNLGHVVLWCDIPTVPLEYIIEQKYILSMHNFTVAIINGRYIYQLQSSHNQAAYVRSIKGNHISVAYIRQKLISGRYLGLIYKDT